MAELSVSEAASTTGVSSKTIRRRLQEPISDLYDGKRPDRSLPNVWRDEEGQWWIPESDLEAAGWDVGIVYEEALGAPLDDEDWRSRAHVAEALVDELRGRLADKDQTIEALQTALDAVRSES